MTEIEKAIRRIIKKNPGAAPLFKNLDVKWAAPEDTQGNWAEYYDRRESGPPDKPNPYRGRNTLLINKDRVGNNSEVLDEVILGDAMHQAPEIFPELYRRFTSGADEKYRAAMRSRYERIGDSRPFNDWLKYSGHDAMIRGGLLSEHPAHKKQGWGGFLKKFPFSKQQYMAVGDLKRKLKN
tara:strand:- start:12267 stop:12809 length:543 start_codon:yes stop_codon:yes gene_type:complete